MAFRVLPHHLLILCIWLFATYITEATQYPISPDTLSKEDKPKYWKYVAMADDAKQQPKVLCNSILFGALALHHNFWFDKPDDTFMESSGRAKAWDEFLLDYFYQGTSDDTIPFEQSELPRTAIESMPHFKTSPHGSLAISVYEMFRELHDDILIKHQQHIRFGLNPSMPRKSTDYASILMYTVPSRDPYDISRPSFTNKDSSPNPAQYFSILKKIMEEDMGDTKVVEKMSIQLEAIDKVVLKHAKTSDNIIFATRNVYWTERRQSKCDSHKYSAFYAAEGFYKVILNLYGHTLKSLALEPKASSLWKSTRSIPGTLDITNSIKKTLLLRMLKWGDVYTV